MKKIVTPWVPDVRKSDLNDFISTAESAFNHINTEPKLERVLRKMCLIEDFAKCDATPDPPDSNDIEIDDVDSSSDDEDNTAQEEDESSDTDDDINDDVPVDVHKPITTILMPLAFNLKSFLELPGVFKQILKNTEDIIAENKLNHFINGKLWKEKIKSYKNDDIVIPYHFYVDGAQLNNALGSHSAKGLENFNYITLPTVPTQYQSRLENIFVGSLFDGINLTIF